MKTHKLLISFQVHILEIDVSEGRQMYLDILVIYCCMKNYPKLNGFQQQTLLLHSFYGPVIQMYFSWGPLVPCFS